MHGFGGEGGEGKGKQKEGGRGVHKVWKARSIQTKKGGRGRQKKAPPPPSPSTLSYVLIHICYTWAGMGFFWLPPPPFFHGLFLNLPPYICMYSTSTYVVTKNCSKNFSCFKKKIETFLQKPLFFILYRADLAYFSLCVSNNTLSQLGFFRGQHLTQKETDSIRDLDVLSLSLSFSLFLSLFWRHRCMGEDVVTPARDCCIAPPRVVVSPISHYQKRESGGGARGGEREFSILQGGLSVEEKN